MTKIKEIVFEKKVEKINKTVNAFIIIKYNESVNCDYFQTIKQVNNSNEEVNKVKKDFECLKINIKEIKSLIISQGYKIVTNG